MDEKGLSAETADKIGAIVKKRGSPFEILSELKAEGSKFLENSGSVIALGELDILFRALKEANCLDNLVFDLSLARGLDYYTGVIYEAVFKGTTQVFYSFIVLTNQLCTYGRTGFSRIVSLLTCKNMKFMVHFPHAVQNFFLMCSKFYSADGLFSVLICIIFLYRNIGWFNCGWRTI